MFFLENELHFVYLADFLFKMHKEAHPEVLQSRVKNLHTRLINDFRPKIRSGVKT